MERDFFVEPPAAAPDPGPPVHEFLQHAYAARRGAAAMFLGILLAAFIAAVLIPARFQATAVLTVLPAPEFTVREDAGSHAFSTSALALDQIMKAETEILESDDLHESALHNVGYEKLYPDLRVMPSAGWLRRQLRAALRFLMLPKAQARIGPLNDSMDIALRRFASDLTVLPSKDSNVITLSFSNHDPQRAAQAVNTLLFLYAARRSSLYNDPQLGVIAAQTDAASSAVAGADARLAAFKQDHDISNYATERDLLLQRRAQLERDEADTLIAKAEQHARIQALSLQLNAEPTTIGLYSEHDSDTRMQSVNAALQDLRARLAAMRVRFLDTSRKVLELKAQIKAEAKEAAHLEAGPAASVVRSGRNPSIDALKLDRSRARAEFQAGIAREAAEKIEAVNISAALQRLSADEVSLAALERRKTIAADGFSTASRILAERRLTEAEDALRLAKVRIVQPARVPRQPRPLPFYIIIAGFMGGVCGAFGWIITAFLRRPVFLTEEGLVYATGFSVLAVFPTIPDMVSDSVFAS